MRSSTRRTWVHDDPTHEAAPERAPNRSAPARVEPENASGLLTLQATGGNQMTVRLLESARSGNRTSGDDMAARIRARLGGGDPLPADLRANMEAGLGQQLGAVRLHRDAEAAALASNLSARAFTTGSDIFFGSGAYDPSSQDGYAVLAHELVHTMQQQSGPVAGQQVSGDLIVSEPSDHYERAASALAQRITAQRDALSSSIEHSCSPDQHGGVSPDYDRMRRRFGLLALQRTPVPGLVIQRDAESDALAAARSHRYSEASAALGQVGWLSRDNVSMRMLSELSDADLVEMARTAAGVALLQQMRTELRSGLTSSDEAGKVSFIDALLGDRVARDMHNRRVIDTIKSGTGSDLEALARMFDSDHVIDDGTVTSRFTAILDVTEHDVIPGLQTGIPFQDTGFRGDQRPGGEGFRDPHPSSRNQVGHFLTAVGLDLRPEVVSRSIPIFGSIRQMVGAPAGMSDGDVALRLTIGHEKAPDQDSSLAIAMRVIITGGLEWLTPGPEDETDEQRDERAVRAGLDQAGVEIRAVIAGFRRQFQAATDDDVRSWNEATASVGEGDRLNMTAAEPHLRQIPINPATRGNSIQDLRLSLVGWRLGELVRAGRFGTRAEVAHWIIANLGP